MAWFRKKSVETIYAERIYEGLVGPEDLGDMTPQRLRLPTNTHERYREKSLFYREAWALAALATVASAQKLDPVLWELKRLIQAKRAKRGTSSPDEPIYSAFDSLEDLGDDPAKWAKRWLMEFRHDPDDNYMVVLFADHWLRVFSAVKNAIEQTRK
jgi:hypothetical protein